MSNTHVEKRFLGVYLCQCRISCLRWTSGGSTRLRCVSATRRPLTLRLTRQTPRRPKHRMPGLPVKYVSNVVKPPEDCTSEARALPEKNCCRIEFMVYEHHMKLSFLADAQNNKHCFFLLRWRYMQRFETSSVIGR